MKHEASQRIKKLYSHTENADVTIKKISYVRNKLQLKRSEEKKKIKNQKSARKKRMREKKKIAFPKRINTLSCIETKVAKELRTNHLSNIKKKRVAFHRFANTVRILCTKRT